MIGLVLIALYSIIVAGTIFDVGPEQVVRPPGFYRFVTVAGIASPLALASLVATRAALGPLVTGAVAAGCTITLLIRIARSEATPQGIVFTLVFVAVVLAVELAVAAYDRRHAR
jgi:hypothetical protein